MIPLFWENLNPYYHWSVQENLQSFLMSCTSAWNALIYCALCKFDVLTHTSSVFLIVLINQFFHCVCYITSVSLCTSIYPMNVIAY